MSTPKQILSQANAAYQAGDFRTARKLSAELLQSENVDPKIKDDAGQIRNAIASDPIAIVAFAVTLFLMAFIALKFLL